MAEPLKTFFSPALVRRLAADLTAVAPSFPAAAFTRQAIRGLDELELLDRGKHIARALGDHLPPDYPQAIDVLLRSLGPGRAAPAGPGGDELLGAGMAPFYYLPHTVFVAERGLDHFELSMRAQYELTRRFTAEFCIRPYIARDPERTFARLAEWARDDDAHVRRLVSEGTRVRLPWGRRVSWLDENPDRILLLLEGLKDDPSSAVRRSVANNLNDLAKLFPDVVIDTCRRWLTGAPPDRVALVRHALRSLVKRGHIGALTLLGAGKTPRVRVDRVRLSPRSVRVGGELRFTFLLESTTNKAQDLVVDYAVHFVKASGATSPKVFKLKRITLEPGHVVELQSKVSFAPMTTRRPHPGKHRIAARINGVDYPLGEVMVHA